MPEASGRCAPDRHAGGMPGLRLARRAARGAGRLQVHRRRAQVPRAARRVAACILPAAAPWTSRASVRSSSSSWSNDGSGEHAGRPLHADAKSARGARAHGREVGAERRRCDRRRARRPRCRGCCSRSAFRRSANRRRWRWRSSSAASRSSRPRAPRRSRRRRTSGPIVSRSVFEFFQSSLAKSVVERLKASGVT